MGRLEIQKEDLIRTGLVDPNQQQELDLASQIANHSDFQDAMTSGSARRADFVMRSLTGPQIEGHPAARLSAGLAVLRKKRQTKSS